MAKAEGSRIATAGPPEELVPQPGAPGCHQAQAMQHLLQRILGPLLQAHGGPGPGDWGPEDAGDRHLLLCGPALMGKSQLIRWAMRRLSQLCQVPPSSPWVVPLLPWVLPPLP